MNNERDIAMNTQPYDEDLGLPFERVPASVDQVETKVVIEPIHWIHASQELPDAGSEVLVCFERNDCFERDTCIAVFDDSRSDNGSCCWEVDSGLTHFGVVLYWAEKPVGPTRS